MTETAEGPTLRAPGELKDNAVITRYMRWQENRNLQFEDYSELWSGP